MILTNCLSIILVAALLFGASKNSKKDENAITPHTTFTPSSSTLELAVTPEALSKKEFVVGEDALVLKVRVNNAHPGALQMHCSRQLGGAFLDAVEKGDSKEMKRLLEQEEADVNARDSKGETALNFATKRGHKKVISLLLDKGTSVEAKNKYGQTPLHWAAFCGHKKIASLLLENGASVEAKDIAGDTPLHWAAEKGEKNSRLPDSAARSCGCNQ